MPEEKGEAPEFTLRRVLPWTDIFRAFTIALDPSKLLLATAAVVLIWFGWFILSAIFQEPNEFGQWPADAQRGANPFVVMTERPGSIVTQEFWLGSEVNRPVHLEPFQKFLSPLFGLFKTTPGHRQWWYLLLGILWTVGVWGVFGGAITRIAAVQYARSEKIGMMEALRFAAGKFTHFASAPLIPFGVLAVIAILMFLGGLLLLIPWVGDLLAGLLWFLPLLGAVLMAIGLLGYVGWPLMYATISAEGSDNFDALSRSYIYVFSKPLHYLWYAFVAVVFGMVVTFFVVFFMSMTVHLARWGVGLSSAVQYRKPDPVQALFVYAPTSYHWDRLLLFGREQEPLSAAEFEAQRQDIINNMDAVPKMCAGIMAFWLHLLFLVMIGFAYSFFWSASTIIYFLLRKRVDDTETDEVYMEEEDEAFQVPPPAPMTSPSSLPMADAPRGPSEPPKPEAASAPKPGASSSAGDGSTPGV
jgi:hypothetical protein